MSKYIFMIQSSVDVHLGWFCFLAIVKGATMNMDACTSISVGRYGVSTYMPKSRTAVSCGNSVFHFLRDLHNNLCHADLTV